MINAIRDRAHNAAAQGGFALGQALGGAAVIAAPIIGARHAYNYITEARARTREANQINNNIQQGQNQTNTTLG